MPGGHGPRPICPILFTILRSGWLRHLIHCANWAYVVRTIVRRTYVGHAHVRTLATPNRPLGLRPIGLLAFHGPSALGQLVLGPWSNRPIGLTGLGPIVLSAIRPLAFGQTVLRTLGVLASGLLGPWPYGRLSNRPTGPSAFGRTVLRTLVPWPIVQSPVGPSALQHMDLFGAFGPRSICLGPWSSSYMVV